MPIRMLHHLWPVRVPRPKIVRFVAPAANPEEEEDAALPKRVRALALISVDDPGQG
jgi:hypothetical protein